MIALFQTVDQGAAAQGYMALIGLHLWMGEQLLNPHGQLKSNPVAGLPEALKPEIASLQGFSQIDGLPIDLDAGGMAPARNTQPQAEGGGLLRGDLKGNCSFPGIIGFLT